MSEQEMLDFETNKEMRSSLEKVNEENRKSLKADENF
jgi:hypothetical protein